MKDRNLQEQQDLHLEILSFLVSNTPLWDTGQSGVKPEKVETHGATVLLGETNAIKLKKPVLFSHMDYSSIEKRRHFCEREFTTNCKTAPDLYIDILPVALGPDGAFNLNGEGEIVDHLLRMKRFSAGNRLDEVAERGALTPSLLDDLTDNILTLHRLADIEKDIHKIPKFKSVIDQNFLQLDEFCPDILTLSEVQEYRRQLYRLTEQYAPEFTDRIEKGWVRWGHGDLHSQNGCLLNGKPLLFDAIEYQDDFVIADILYDFAFLIMDLWQRGLKVQANRVFNRYLYGIGWIQNPENLSVLQLLPFYLSVRAGIRTHVEARRSLQSSNDMEKKDHANLCHDFFRASRKYLNPSPPQLIAIGGYSGSGKSTLAGNLAPHIGAAPGAVRLRSDLLRRQLMNWDEFSPMPQTAYTSEISQQVYDKMREIAGHILSAGHSVIMDAVLDREIDQDAFEKVAKNNGVPFTGIWLDVRRSIMTSRIENRTRDASDATVAVLEKQLATKSENKNSWQRVDGNGSEEETLSRALAVLGN